jgi:serine/threonine protein phosphatase 1
MISRFFSHRRQQRAEPSASVPPHQRVYAVGDIHGRLDLLDALLKEIDADDAARNPAETHLILLGDLVDRGPQSAQMIERALELERDRPNAHFLLGNHEEVFLKVLGGDTRALAFFNRIGGRETILSYGISERDYRESDYDELLEMVQQAVPAAHIAFLERFEDLIIIGDYAFVHAGIRPTESLARQKASDLRWIRDEFLDHSGAFEKVVVHGHTISSDVEILNNRIGLDTGAFVSGKLSALGLEDDRRWILQAQK